MLTIFCFLSGFFFLGFTFAFSGGGSNALSLGLCFSSSFGGNTIRFAFFRLDTSVFFCKGVGGFLFSGNTDAFSLSGSGFVSYTLALGFFFG